MATGAYCWFNKKKGKVYVGGAYKSFKERKQGHLNCLVRGDHPNRFFQRAWNKYGSESFQFIILSKCAVEEVRDHEQFWLDFHRATDCRFGYNICPTAGSNLGRKLSTAARKKVSRFQTGRKHSEETCIKRSIGIRARHAADPSVGKRIAAGIRAFFKSNPEACALRSEQLRDRHRKDPSILFRAGSANKGRKHTTKARENMSKGRKGMVLSKAHKRKIAEGLRRAYKEGRMKSKKGTILSEAHRLKIAEGVRRVFEKR